MLLVTRMEEYLKSGSWPQNMRLFNDRVILTFNYFASEWKNLLVFTHFDLKGTSTDN